MRPPLIALLSYLGAHWLLLIIVVLSTVALGLLAWFTKNLKYVLAAVVLVIAGLAYQSANMDGYRRKVAEDAQVQIDALSKRLLAVNMAAAADAKRATADAYLNTKLDALSRETPRNDSSCLDLASARRVWAISGPDALDAPLPARRHPKLLPWRHKGP
jgi:apolipoprotein N-acyltransferase